MQRVLSKPFLTAILSLFLITNVSPATIASPNTFLSKLKNNKIPCAVALSLLGIYLYGSYEETQLRYRMDAEPRMGWENLSQLKGSLPKFTESKILNGEKYPSTALPLTYVSQLHGREDYNVLTPNENQQIVNSQIDLAIFLLSIAGKNPKIFIEGLAINLNQETRRQLEMIERGELRLQDTEIPQSIYNEYILVKKYFPLGVPLTDISASREKRDMQTGALFFVGAAKILFYTGGLEELYGAESVEVQNKIRGFLKRRGLTAPSELMWRYDSDFRGAVFWEREMAALKIIWNNHKQDLSSTRPYYLVFGDLHDFQYYSGRLFSITPPNASNIP